MFNKVLDLIRYFGRLCHIFLLAPLIFLGIPQIQASSGQPISENRDQEYFTYDESIFSHILDERLVAMNETYPYNLRETKVYARQYLRALYKLNQHRPLWHQKKMYEAYLDMLENIYLDGLLKEDYNYKVIKDLYNKLTKNTKIDHDILVDLDIITMHSYLLLCLHLEDGKLEPSLIDSAWNYDHTNTEDIKPSKIYSCLKMGDIGNCLDDIRKQSLLYMEMRQTLADLYELKEKGGWSEISFNNQVSAIRLGESASFIPGVRKRLLASHDLAGNGDLQNERVDSTLFKAIQKFQHRHGLTDDGILGKQTLIAMNQSVDQKIEKVRVNLERIRWLKNESVSKRVLINLPEYSAYLVKGSLSDPSGRGIKYKEKVIIGKPYKETPIFEAKIAYIEFNPTWTVPRSITVGEMLPKIRKDPGYLGKNNLRLLNYSGEEVSLENVDLEDSSFPYVIRQDPGPGNALGQVKIIFPNQFSVYMHDTPSRGLFSEEKRAFSHGCIRVNNPLHWAEILLEDPQWSQEKIKSVIASGETIRVTPEEDILVMIAYMTHITDWNGQAFYYEDIYDRDKKVLELLNQPVNQKHLDYKREKFASVLK